MQTLNYGPDNCRTEFRKPDSLWDYARLVFTGWKPLWLGGWWQR